MYVGVYVRCEICACISVFPRPFGTLAARITLPRVDREELKLSAAPSIIPGRAREKSLAPREIFAAKYDGDNLPRPFYALFFKLSPSSLSLFLFFFFFSFNRRKCEALQKDVPRHTLNALTSASLHMGFRLVTRSFVLHSLACSMRGMNGAK